MRGEGFAQGMILSDVPHPADPTSQYLFYLSGYIVEAGNTRPVSPKFGAYEYAMVSLLSAKHERRILRLNLTRAN